MIIVIALIGLAMGYILNRISDYAPRFAVTETKRFVTARALDISVMVISMVVFAGLWVWLEGSVEWFFISASYFFFMLIALIDIKYRLILNIFTYPTIAAILIIRLLLIREDTLNILIGGLLAFGIFVLTAYLKPGDVGGGDIKLATLIGLWFGFPQVLWALIIGVGTGGLAAIAILLMPGQQRYIPYAPFLCLGAMIGLIYNPLLIS